MRASDLRYWNNIRRNLIRSGQKLVIYKPKGKSARYKGISSMSFSEKQQFAGRAISTSQAAKSPSPTSAISSSSSTSNEEFVTYTVRRGDTLWEIAKQFPGISETDIAKLNKISDASQIKPGQVIRIKRKG